MMMCGLRKFSTSVLSFLLELKLLSESTIAPSDNVKMLMLKNRL